MRLLFLVGLAACTVLVVICLPQEKANGQGRGGGRGRSPWKELTDEEKAEEKLPLEERFQKFKEKFGKKYKDADQERGRKEKFRKNREKIDAHNKLFDEGKSTYRMAINEFSDMDEDEFIAKMTGVKKPTDEELESMDIDIRREPKKRATLPESLDYRDSGMVTRVKDQGSCGSCWAFATVGGLEALYFKETGTLVEFNEQQLVDCVYGRDGCEGGFSYSGINYVKTHGGLSTAEDYPYTGEYYGSCQNKPKTVIPIARGHLAIAATEEDTRQLFVTTGRPIEVTICANGEIQSYQSGVFSEASPTCNSDCGEARTNHEVLLVGYGTLDDIDYWIIKNSWNAAWGNEGYLYIERNKGMCHVAYEVVWAEAEITVPELTCKRTELGQEYAGTLAVTVNNLACQRWDSQTPHEHEQTATSMVEGTLTDAQNYCRNPDAESGGPWCYTTDAAQRWEFCDVQICECKRTELGQEYSGIVAVTVNSLACQRWDSQTPHEHTQTAANMPEGTLTDAQNYCRNPDGEAGGPWCYTTDAAQRYEYCTIPTC